jgi:hypothetical protein
MVVTAALDFGAKNMLNSAALMAVMAAEAATSLQKSPKA